MREQGNGGVKRIRRQASLLTILGAFMIMILLTAAPGLAQEQGEASGTPGIDPGGGAVASADPLDTWTVRSSGTTDVFEGVTYGNNTFVAVGSGGTILTSPDGASWTARNSGTTNHLGGVTYGNGTFVAVGGVFSTGTAIGTILTSPDGVKWTASGTTDDLWGVTYGNNTFVAVGNDGIILTSPDGVTWTARSSGTNEQLFNQLFGVTYGNGVFVAVGGYYGTILTSPDGASWTTRSSGTTNPPLRGVTYGNNTFVAVGGYPISTSPSTILTSPDGITWTNRSSGTTDMLSGVTYGNGTFVAVGISDDILTSPDGVNWTARNSGIYGNLHGVTYGNGAFVAVGNYGTILQSGVVGSGPAPVTINNEQPAYIYNEADPADALELLYADLKQIKDPATAAEIVEKASRLLTPEQKQSSTAIDKITHYAEAAIAQAAAKEIDANEVTINSTLVDDLQATAEEAKTTVEQVLKKNGIVTNRIINTGVKLLVPPSDKFTLTIDNTVLSTAIDNIRVGSPDMEVAVAPAALKTDLTDNAPLIITLEEVGAMTHLGANNSGKELLVSAATSKTVKVSFNKGRVTENIRISLPPAEGTTTYQAVIKEDGEAVTSKYNPATEKIEAKINTGGVYTVKENYKDFSDIQNNAQEMQDAIRYLASKGIISGTSTTTFSPDGSISRAEIAAMIVRALGKMDANADGGFTDVTRNNWYYGTAGSSKRYGIITGYEDNTFRGTLVIPKDQIVAVAARTLKQEMKYKEPENKALYLNYSDSGSIAAWAVNDIAMATRENLVVKRTDGKFQPESNMTRGDAAIILKRMFDKIW